MLLHGINPDCELNRLAYVIWSHGSPMIELTEPTTKDELQDALDKIIQSAFQNGVALDDGEYLLLCESDPTWEVQLIRMADGYDFMSGTS